MYSKINSEFLFIKKINDKREVSLILYIDYQHKTYDFMQHSEEGIFPRRFPTETETNKAYFELALEVLEFLDKELYGAKPSKSSNSEV